MNRQKSAAAYRATSEKQTASRRSRARLLLCAVAVILGGLGGYLLFAVLVISAAQLSEPQGIYGIAVACAAVAALYFSAAYAVLAGLLRIRLFSAAAGKKTAWHLTFLSLGIALLFVMLTQIL